MLRYTYFEKNSPNFRRKLPVSSCGSKTRSQLTILKGRSYFYPRNIHAQKLDFDHSFFVTSKAYWTILVLLNIKRNLIKMFILLASIFKNNSNAGRSTKVNEHCKFFRLVVLTSLKQEDFFDFWRNMHSSWYFSDFIICSTLIKKTCRLKKNS